ncbi:MAG: type VI secretion system Vgr family protein [Desulfovibrio sp.]|jgi:type VI secretion system secreted protein VgrG|nr:type VI secretion system Vgr family protein [Desulfovibrio sp.]
MPADWEFFAASEPGDPAFRVLAFNGEDAIAEGYAFDILLLASGIPPKNAQKTQEELMSAPLLTLRGKRRADNATFDWRGMAAEVSRCFSVSAGTVFRVLLRPRSWKLRFSTHSRIFLDMPLPKLLERLLVLEGLAAGTDFDDTLKGGYKPRPFTCQYNESAFAFLARHLERVGAYSYIRQTDSGDVLVFTDGSAEAEALPLRDALDWGENRDTTDEAVLSLVRTLAAGPAKVELRDYCTEHPGLTSGQASSTSGQWRKGALAFYGESGLFGEVDCLGKKFSAENANARAGELAAARLRAADCVADFATGKSLVPWLRAGYAVALDGEKYQILRVRHRCRRPDDELGGEILEKARGLGLLSEKEGDGKAGYGNDFVCHPLSAGPYAPERRTPWPVMPGVLPAVVDAAGDGEYAEMDDEGRYKVKFFFPEKVFRADAEVTTDGNNSIPLRMMQEHAGQNSGIHFPLQKKVEVLVAFVNGNPDRPVILGALPNPEHPSVVVDKNRQNNVIRTPGGQAISMTDTVGKKELSLKTAGGHGITMRDENGKRELRLQSPCGGNYIRIHEK